MLFFIVYNDNSESHYLDQLLKSVEKYGNEFKIIVYNKAEIDDEFLKKITKY